MGLTQYAQVFPDDATALTALNAAAPAGG